MTLSRNMTGKDYTIFSNSPRRMWASHVRRAYPATALDLRTTGRCITHDPLTNNGIHPIAVPSPVGRERVRVRVRLPKIGGSVRIRPCPARPIHGARTFRFQARPEKSSPAGEFNHPGRSLHGGRFRSIDGRTGPTCVCRQLFPTVRVRCRHRGRPPSRRKRLH